MCVGINQFHKSYRLLGDIIGAFILSQTEGRVKEGRRGKLTLIGSPGRNFFGPFGLFVLTTPFFRAIIEDIEAPFDGDEGTSAAVSINLMRRRDMDAQMALLLLSSYFIGAIPFAYLVTRMATGQDIRYVGEGNVGARNVWHTAGPFYGLIAGVLDVSKGFVVFQLASRMATSELAFYAAGAAALLGHGFPVFLRGRGGKGISVAVGFLLGIIPQALVVGALLFGTTWLVTRNFNFSIAIGLGSVPFVGLYLGLAPGEVLRIIAIMLIMGLKKVVDLPHERRIREQSGWFEPQGIIQRRER